MCEYPSDVNTTLRSSGFPTSLSAWSAQSYNYFGQLSGAGKASSCALQGPCYPVLTSQANVWHSCQTQTLEDLPLDTLAVGRLTTCINCCTTVVNASRNAVCNATDVNGLPAAMGWTGATGPNATSNARIGCLQSCQNLHGSIAAFDAATEGSVHPLALALFDATCAAAGLDAAPVPAPATADNGAMAAVLSAVASTYKATAVRYAADMLLSWKALVVTGLFLPFIMSLFWVFLIKYITGPLVWLTLLCVDAATLGCTLFCFSKAGSFGGNAFDGIVSYSDSNGFSFNAAQATAAGNQFLTVPADTDSVVAVQMFDIGAISKKQMYYLGIACGVLTVATWIFSIILVPRLRVSIATIKVAAQALQSVPTLILFPLFPGLALSGFMVGWVIVGLYVYSSGKIVKRDCCADVQAAFADLYPTFAGANGGGPSCSEIHCGYEVKMNQRLQHALIYHGAEFLWTTQWIIAFGILTVSHVVHKCYLYAGGEPGGLALPRFPVCRASWTTVRYYLGSISLGSLFVATFQMFRYVMAYFTAKLKKVADANTLVKALLWLANCLLWLLETIVKFISHNAYVLIAINGSGFCSAAGQATKAVLTNGLRYVTLVVVSDAILFLGKVGTAASSAFFCFVYLDKSYPDGTLSSPLVPVIVVFLTAFAMASLVFGVVEQAVTATLLCLIDDEDRHDGAAKYAPLALKEATDALDKMHADEAEKKRKGGCCTRPQADA